MPTAEQTPAPAAEAPKPREWKAWYFARRGLITIPFYAPLALVFWKRWEHPEITWPAGATLVLCGCLLRLFSVRHLGRSARAHQAKAYRLSQGGPYSWTRNPIYLATLLMVAGYGVLSRLFWYAPFLVVFVAVHYTIVILHEEWRLQEAFGDEFREYCRCVPRWLPRLPKSAVPSEPLPWGDVWRREWRMAAGVLAGIGIMLLREFLPSLLS